MINMNLKCVLALGAFVLTGLFAPAGNIDVSSAREGANLFLKHHASTKPGTIKAPALSDLKLAYTEASSVIDGANDFYAFNVTGGGFIIMSGEDRANQVLAYSLDGHLDFNNLPENVKALLNGYKGEIEFLQSHPQLTVEPVQRLASASSVAPLIKSHWGQEMPYYLQCPIYNNEYCVVGCVATAMSQVMHYWQYPTKSPELNSYYCYDIGQTIPALPETNFEYGKMLNSYCHWDWDRGELVQDTYTDAQAQAVAKLGRYCGQAVNMGYSPDGSGAYVSSQLDAMKEFGFSSSARDVSKSSWWEDNYTTAQWEAMIKTELDAGRPILYSANDPAAGGHAFICDGYDQQGFFHFNFGWYGTCDGYYASTALNMTHRDGESLHFNSGHEMLIGVEPPEYCVISTNPLMAASGLLVLGDDLNPHADVLSLMCTYPSINMRFTLSNSTGRLMASSSVVKLTSGDYAQTTELNASLTLPSTLESGIYDLNLQYYQSSPKMAIRLNCESSQLEVVGKAAKYGEPFQVEDVVTLIDYVLSGEKAGLDITDVVYVIEHVLEG